MHDSSDRSQAQSHDFSVSPSHHYVKCFLYLLSHMKYSVLSVSVRGKKKSLFTSEYSAADKSSSLIAVQVLEKDLSSDDGGYLLLKRGERGPTGAVCCVNMA